MAASSITYLWQEKKAKLAQLPLKSCRCRDIRQPVLVIYSGTFKMMKTPQCYSPVTRFLCPTLVQAVAIFRVGVPKLCTRLSPRAFTVYRIKQRFTWATIINRVGGS